VGMGTGIATGVRAAMGRRSRGSRHNGSVHWSEEPAILVEHEVGNVRVG
jgi:hypothetical protein